jgi:hypothetical protein
LPGYGFDRFNEDIGVVVLPARSEELERVQLELELRRRLSSTNFLQELVQEEQREQQRLQHEFDTRLSPLRNDLERIVSEISRLESRLDRMMFSGKSASDEELDQEADDARADEAAWWAEWRHKQSERSNQRISKSVSPMPDDIQMRRLYRTLARLVHPDRSADQADRERREEIMRQANEAKEARDLVWMQHLLSSWSADDNEIPSDIEALRARIAELGLEHQQLRRELNQLKESALGRLIRLSERDLRRHIRREESKLRRELALTRLRRRRVLRTLEERRETLSTSTGDA